jgi:ATP-dependent helicase/nuclease subunit B
LIPPRLDLADRAAAQIVRAHAGSLPDLSNLVLLVPHPAAAPRLRERFTHHAGGALLGPRILNLAQFAAEYGEAPAPVSPSECRLILVGALHRHRGLFPGQDPWQLAEALFKLFEELTCNAVPPSSDEDSFAARLAAGYGARPFAALSREAQLVHRLWLVFGEYTEGRSPAATYLQSLRSAFDTVSAKNPVHLLGFDEFTGGERAILRPALIDGRARLWLQGRTAGRDGIALHELNTILSSDSANASVDDGSEPARARTAFLDAVFSTSKTAVPTLDSGLRLTAAEGPEHEARCVELAVREAFLTGSNDIAVVTQDRRLARRLRALLERANVTLHDEIGWVLSTSAAAATLNAFLDAVESGFQFRPLLDLLKSSFLDVDAEALRTLERDLIYRHGIESGLDRYRARVVDTNPALAAWLERLAEAARMLPPANQARGGEIWSGALLRTIEHLGLRERWETDEAGMRLLGTLRELEAALTKHAQRLDWHDFRLLLNRSIESATFVPTPALSAQRVRVRLLTLEQSALLRCDALVLAGATRAQIPGPAAAEPFFNQSVRTELGLPNLPQRHALTLARLRRVLEAAPRVQITFAPETPGEPAQLSPWIEAIEAAAESAGQTLRDSALAARAGIAAVDIAVATGPAPPRRQQPRPPAPVALLPDALSATAHQALIDCPYQFFAARVLRLAVENAPDEDPDRADFGERLHRILQAFTQPVDGLPPPFADAVTERNRADAQRHLEMITEAVLGADLRQRALAYVWLTQARAAIPLLLDWLQQRPPARVHAECRMETAFGSRFRLVGTIDRVEERADGQTIVDYKTGRIPRRLDVESGEAVQLVHYALLDTRVTRVEYLPLREDETALVIDEPLDELRAAVGARLQRTLDALSRGEPLSALGDGGTCRRCEYGGVCRKTDWVIE